jgi:hypothetical protein
MIIEGQAKSGAQTPILAGAERDMLASQWLPQYYHATRAGRTFYTETQALTMAATHATPIDAATDTFICGFINPANSGKNAVILYGWFATVSGTPSAQAHPVWNYATLAGSVTAASTGTIKCGLIQMGSPSVMRPASNIALTGLVVTTGSLGAIRPFGFDTFAGATAANASNGSTDYVDGAIVVPPGAAIGICAGTGAGTSWVVSAGMSWMEVDI